MAVIDRFLDDLAARANRHAIFYLIRPFLADPDDELILELALASASSYIVTHNRDDFGDAGRFGLGVLRPGWGGTMTGLAVTAAVVVTAV